MKTLRETYKRLAIVLAGSTIAGCAAPHTTAADPSHGIVNHQVSSPSAPHSASDSRGGAAPRSKSTPVKLAAYEVKDSAFSDFGMSVKTNYEVTWGGTIEWMLVSGVDPGSSAARMGLALGDRILAIDGRKIMEMDRDAMLDRLFQRKKGDRSRVLLIGAREALPRFVVLVASRPEPGRVQQQ